MKKLNGLYRCDKRSQLYHEHTTIEVKETDKTYIFKLVDHNWRYSFGHVENMFKDKLRVVIKKNKSAHAIQRWNDGSFTLYPYRAGIPFYFAPIRTTVKEVKS